MLTVVCNYRSGQVVGSAGDGALRSPHSSSTLNFSSSPQDTASPHSRSSDGSDNSKRVFMYSPVHLAADKYVFDIKCYSILVVMAIHVTVYIPGPAVLVWSTTWTPHWTMSLSPL